MIEMIILVAISLLIFLLVVIGIKALAHHTKPNAHTNTISSEGKLPPYVDSDSGNDY